MVLFICLNKHSLDNARVIVLGPEVHRLYDQAPDGRREALFVFLEETGGLRSCGREKEALGAACLMHRSTFPCQTSLWLAEFKIVSLLRAHVLTIMCVCERAMTGKLFIFIYWITAALDEVRKVHGVVDKGRSLNLKAMGVKLETEWDSILQGKWRFDGVSGFIRYVLQRKRMLKLNFFSSLL